MIRKFYFFLSILLLSFHTFAAENGENGDPIDGKIEGDFEFPIAEYQKIPDVIIGDPDFEKMRDLPTNSRDYQLGRKVGWLARPLRNSPHVAGVCTGFLVGPDLFLTNQHCIASNVTDALILMDYYQEFADDNTFGGITARVSAVVRADAEKDYALLRLDKPIGNTYGWLELDTTTVPDTSQSVKLISHPRSRSKEIVRRNSQIINLPRGHPLFGVPYALSYLADTEGGSSGSPVFLRDGTGVIAIHHSSFISPITGPFNTSGTLMSYIMPEIQQYLPGVPITFTPGSIADQTFKVGTHATLTLPVVTGGTPPYTYTLSPIPAGLSFDTTTRVLSGTPTTAATATPVTYTTRDAAQRIALLTFTITVTTPSVPNITFTPSSIADQTFTVGKAVHLTLPVATGGTGPYTYTVSPIPAGLSFDTTTRVLSGTPTTAATATRVTYTATDASSVSESLTFTVTVTDPLAFNPSVIADQTFTVGEAVHLTLPVATGGTGPYTYTVSPIPAGLSFDTATRILSGTPTTAATATPVTYTTRDAAQRIASLTFTITVTAPPVTNITFTPGSIADQTFRVGTAVNLTLPVATGGTAPYTYTLSPIPAGLSFHPTTRILSGTPTTATPETRATYTATDASRASAALTFTVTVTDPLAFNPGAIADQTFIVGTAVILTLPVATGGTAPYTYTLSPIPAGLAFNTTTRVLSGTPTTAATATSVTYTVRDAARINASLTFTITVRGKPTFNPSTVADQTFTVGEAVILTLPVATGGTAPYAYTLSPIPAGLSFHPATRVLSGTPTTAGTTSATYTATDAADVSASLTFTIEVAPDLDVNADGQVTVIDLAMVALFYGTQVPDGVDLSADVNADGTVNILDLTAVAQAIDAAGNSSELSVDDVAAVLEAIADIEAIAEAPARFSKDRRDWVLQFPLRAGVTYRNVAAAFAAAKPLTTEDARLGKWMPLLKELLHLLREMREIPDTTALLPNYPNPFNPETWIPYHLSKGTEVILTIYDVRGVLVRKLTLGHQAAGIYESRARAAYWDGRNASGEPVASGLYFYTLTAGDFTATRKLLIVK